MKVGSRLRGSFIGIDLGGVKLLRAFPKRFGSITSLAEPKVLQLPTEEADMLEDLTCAGAPRNPCLGATCPLQTRWETVVFRTAGQPGN